MLPSKSITPFLGIWYERTSPSVQFFLSPDKQQLTKKRIYEHLRHPRPSANYSKEYPLHTTHTPCRLLPLVHLPPRLPPRDFGLRPAGLLLPPLPPNPDNLRGLPSLWPRPHFPPLHPPLWPRPRSGRSLAPAPTAPAAYARTPLCLRGPLWTTLSDLSPTSGASTKFGTI